MLNVGENGDGARPSIPKPCASVPGIEKDGVASFGPKPCMVSLCIESARLNCPFIFMPSFASEVMNAAGFVKPGTPAIAAALPSPMPSIELRLTGPICGPPRSRPSAPGMLPIAPGKFPLSNELKKPVIGLLFSDCVAACCGPVMSANDTLGGPELASLLPPPPPHHGAWYGTRGAPGLGAPPG